MSFQQSVAPWVVACFGKEKAHDSRERNLRFIEEALELVQTLHCTKDDVLRIVEYVYNRSIGQASQEVGGVMVTLAALCAAQGIDMHRCGETELDRCWQMIEEIRVKNLGKPLP